MGESTDWKFLRSKLQYEKAQPLYSSEIHRYVGSLLRAPYHEQSDLIPSYLDTIDKWIKSSELNRLEGLDTFPHRDFLIGVTHALDDLHIHYGDRLAVLEEEYSYHRRIQPQTKVRRVETLSEGDVLVISLPYSHIGDIHHNMDEILTICLKKNIPVRIDSAWYGTCRGIHFNYNHPAIQTVSFSLSKGLCLGRQRSGIRYSKERKPGPVTVTNDFKFYMESSAWIGLKCMHSFGPDFLQKKYYKFYMEVCNNLNLQPSPTIFIAYEKDQQGLSRSVGVRPPVRWLAEKRY